ncbi:MAG TPA: 3-hydroxyacyl-CoA dehydrogenase [Deltaproteobacteria bacterium]|nr:MAG: 3-hydroxy-2-methylbutyryl-CoA dehydrogenase [Deltaproteobacteria bacterium GWC2_65_14]HBO69331.1 3-hydroxyacyl-CoA dehydrogenase [Deltaproteobacteria bacterium]
MEIRNHTFLVTGGSSGLGAATAVLLAGEGAQVVVADRKPPEKAVQALVTAGKIRYVETDVTDEKSAGAAVDAAAAAGGGLRGLVNCAGVAVAERVLGKSGPHALASFAFCVQVNLVGTFNMIRLAAAEMAKRDPLPTGERGVIVNTASVAAYEGQIGQAAYAASKAGIVGLTLPAARDLSGLGIRVNTIAPGIFDTPMLAGMSDEVRESLGKMAPFPRRLGQPSEYAALVRHIVENPMINGEVIRLDGAIRLAPR